MFTQPVYNPTAKTANPQFMNFTQVGKEELEVALEAMGSGEAIMLVANGAIMLISEESVLAAYNLYKGKASLRRIATGGTNASGNPRPICNIQLSNDLNGAMWGSFNINIPVDAVPELSPDTVETPAVTTDSDDLPF